MQARNFLANLLALLFRKEATTDSSEQKPLPEKLWSFGESPFTWGGIGLIVGAIAVVVSLKVLFVIGGIPIVCGLIRARFFEGMKRWLVVLGNAILCVLITTILWGVWKVVPKPKEFPTAEDIATAVINKQREAVQPTTRTGEETSVPSIGNAAPPKPKPKPKPQPTVEPPAKLSISQKSDVSSRQDALYKINITVQTTKEFQSLKMVIQCDKEIVDGSAGVASGGVMIMTSQGVVKEHPNLFIFTYQSAAPTFSPSNPVVANFWSREPITCNQVATY